MAVMSPSTRSRTGLFAMPLLAAGLLAATAPRTAAAQASVRSAEARAAQFVFVIDDSGSMRQTDPNRLAVFAVQSLLGMLDDRDEVSVVRLNAPRDGSPPPPVEPLSENRARMERLLALDGSLAAYAAGKTPCTSALRAVHGLLEASYRPEVAQVVFFLTDGKCEPPDFDRDEARTFLHGLPSQEAGRFQFYLLRFRGQAVSQELVRLAEETGGAAVEVAADDPTAILHPFAQALSRSQGYRSYLLGPGDPRLPAHRGAERVRLLAVAPGRGPALDLTVHDARGRSLETLGAVRTGVHQYGGGKVFRFAALDYRPGVVPVSVAVQGAGADWKVVAVPEYRLTLALEVHRGPCSSPGERAEFGVDTGSSVCAVVELRNDRGEPVGSALSKEELVARVRVSRPDQPGAAPLDLVANPMAGLEGNPARWGLQRSNLPRGQYELEPEATIRLGPEESVTLRGLPVALEVSSAEIEPEPARLDLGTLVPGGGALKTVRFTGAFPAEPGRIELRDRGEIPACVTVTLSGVAEGEAQPILVDHGYELAVRVAPYCGPKSFERQVRTLLRLVFDDSGGGRRLPAVEVPLTFTLDVEITPPAALSFDLDGGRARTVPVPIHGNFRRGLALTAMVAPGETGAWPEDPDDLAVTAAAGGGTGPEGGATYAPGGGEALILTARAARCCAGGAYRTRLGLVPADPSAYAPEGSAVEPLVVPVEVRVASAGIWACWGPIVLWSLLALALLLLALYLAGMVRHSHLLDPRALADRLRPLVWTAGGGTEERRNAQDDVRRMVRRGLPWGGRIGAWLRANPLRFGLPGGRYEETAELTLQPHHDVAVSHARLLARRGGLDAIRREPAEYLGRLFASARAGVTLLAVPTPEGRIGALAVDGAVAPRDVGGGPDGAPQPRPLTLRRTALIRPLDPREAPEEGAAAGWRVG